MKNPTKFLTLLLTEWTFAMRQPQLCKAVILARKTFRGDVFTAQLVHALLCSAGDWKAASKFMERTHPEFFKRVQAFRAWAAKITGPKKRGLLLEWKGGAA